MPQPIQVSADRTRVATALRSVLAALDSHPIRTSRLSVAWDGFRAAFGDGPTPERVSLDGVGLPDLYGMRALLRASTGITSEERDALGDVVNAMTGGIFVSAWVYRDAAGDPEPSAAAIREHEREAESADDTLIRDAKKAIRAAVSMLGGPGDSTSPMGRVAKSVPPAITASVAPETPFDVSPSGAPPGTPDRGISSVAPALDSDPLAAVCELVARLGRTTPSAWGNNFSPEDWTVWCETWDSAREEYRTRADALFSDLYRWLRDGLEDHSFAAARSEVDTARSLVTHLAGVEVPLSIAVTEPQPDGTAVRRVVISSLDSRPLAAANRKLQTAVRVLARWRDCRRADVAPMTTAPGDWREPVAPPVEQCSALGSYSDQELSEFRFKCYPPVPLVELRPSRPIPPECEIIAAMREVPVALSESRFGGRTIHLPVDPSEHRLAVAAWLAFAEEQGHGRAAAEWAIYRLAEAGRLRVVWPRVYQSLRSEVAAQWMADQAARYRGGRAATVTDWDLFEDGRILELRTTPALWEWNRSGCSTSLVDNAGSPGPESISASPREAEPALPLETKTAEGDQSNPDDKPDGPFDIDGFRFAGGG
ncbi:unnamed protein product [Gemmataceae bacterium]|nr:unnamed protein product [Gemmataceae bacterium]VTT98150.1 unnamed protein product [Gemmataceae bacterium]